MAIGLADHKRDPLFRGAVIFDRPGVALDHVPNLGVLFDKNPGEDNRAPGFRARWISANNLSNDVRRQVV